MVQLRELITPAPLVRCGSRELPVLSMTMHDGIMLQSDRFKKSIASVDQSLYKIVKRNQLVVGFPIDEGVLYIQNVVDEGIMSPAYDVWNVDQSKIDLSFLELSLHSPRSMLYYKSNLRGTTARRRSLPKDVLLSLPVCLPSIENQKKISEIIKKTNYSLLLRKQQLQALDDLVKARFVEMFGDPVSSKGKTKKLSDIGCIFTGNTPPMKNLEFYDSKDIPFVKPGDISEDRVTWINRAESFISENARSVARLMPKNSVLVTCIGTIGKIGIATEECSCNQQINYIIPNESVEPVYLAYCIFFVKNILISMANAPVVPIINKSQFSALEIPVAESSKQKQFVAFVSQIDKAKAAVQKALDETQMLFDSLMQEYFG